MSKTISYQVWSTIAEPDQEPRDQLESRRTDKGVAYDDAALIRTVCFRRAWVQEVES